MKTLTDEQLRGFWDDANIASEDLFEHVMQVDSWDYSPIADETLRVFHLVFDEQEPSEPLDWLVAGAAAKGARATIDAVACALNVNSEDLYIAMSYWTEDKYEHPQAMSTQGFLAFVDAFRAKREAYEAKVKQGVNDGNS